MTNLQAVDALLYVAAHGCNWRGLTEQFGNWHTIYTRMRRWAKAGVLYKMFEELQREQVVRVRTQAVSLDSNSIKAVMFCLAPGQVMPPKAGDCSKPWGHEAVAVTVDKVLYERPFASTDACPAT